MVDVLVSKEVEEEITLEEKEVKNEKPQHTKKKTNVEVSDDIIKGLDTIDVCMICKLRLAGMSYGDHTVDDTPVEEGSHCCICLGILEGYTLTSLTQKVSELLEPYESPYFQIGVTLPQCVLLRQTAVIAHLIDRGLDVIQHMALLKTLVRFFLVKLIEKISNKKLNPGSQLLIHVDFTYESDIEEISTLNPLLQAANAPGQKLNKEGKIVDRYNTESVHKVVQGLSSSCVKNYMPCPPPAVSKPCNCDISVRSSQLYIGGRYNKFSRTLYATPYFVDGNRCAETSVLELIGEPLKKFTKGDDIKLKSSVIEDVDVNILGSGHPFAVEIINPKITCITKEQIAKFEAEINASTDMISVHQLQVVTTSELKLMARGEDWKSKTYRAKLLCPGKISNDKIKSLNLMTDIILKQKTPIRVLHRREFSTKERKVHKIELKRAMEKEHYELNVTAQMGVYIKEFVNGDLGRTEPSLRTLLGKPIDIVEIDVIPSSLSWPPSDVKMVEEKVEEKVEESELIEWT